MEDAFKRRLQATAFALKRGNPTRRDLRVVFICLELFVPLGYFRHSLLDSGFPGILGRGCGTAAGSTLAVLHLLQDSIFQTLRTACLVLLEDDAVRQHVMWTLRH